MPTGAITSYVDVAQLVLYAFWIFFVGLIFYLRREDKREGYPLESDRSEQSDRVRVVGFPAPPAPKTFLLPDGSTRTAPREEKPKPHGEIRARPVAAWPGAPLHPSGDPMQAEVGAGAYAEREEVPDMTLEGLPKIVPMRVASDFEVEERGADPRGMEVRGADGKRAGTVQDLWVDRSEPRVLYLELVLADSGETGEARRVLLPINFARIDPRRGHVRVGAIMARHFAGVPGLRDADQITRREEDRITAYYAGGHRYAHPARTESVL